MKRAPQDGEARITHITTNTGDREMFAITPDGFSPDVIAEVRRQLEASDLVSDTAIDFKWLSLVLSNPHEFRMISAGKTISHNTVSWNDERTEVLLYTMIDGVAVFDEEETFHIAADFEQCVAIALSQVNLKEQNQT